MSIEDYLITIALIALVVRQVRGKAVTKFGLLWPVGIVLYAGVTYVRSVPTSGSSLYLILVCTLIGAGLGLLCGALTQVFQRGDQVIAKATGWAVLFWVLGMSARLVFGIFAEHGGGETIARFSAAHSLSLAVWAPALILMSLGEVLGRTVVLAYRSSRARSLVVS